MWYFIVRIPTPSPIFFIGGGDWPYQKSQETGDGQIAEG